MTQQPDTTATPSLLRGASAVLTQGFVLTGLLFYIGWTREQALLRYFGVDTGVVGFSNADYLLRGAGDSITFLALVCGTSMTLIVLARALRQDDRMADAATIVHRYSLTAGLAAGVAGFALLPIAGGSSTITLACSLLFLFACLGLWVRRTLTPSPPQSPHSSPSSSPTTGKDPAAFERAQTAVLGTITGLILLWVSTAYANVSGILQAKALDIRAQPSVQVYSSEDLQLQGPGVVTDTVAGADSAFHHEYHGLYLLVASGRTLFLLPADWSPGRGAVIELSPDGDKTRVEFGRP